MKTRLPAWLMACMTAVLPLSCPAHGAGADPQMRTPPPRWAIGTNLPADGIVELRFAEFFKRPVGPGGLEPSAKLLALRGRPVRIVGYMAAASLPMPGRLVLAPMPVELGDEDEHLADDLPPQAVFVHLSGLASARVIPNYTGLLALSGILELGPREEPDGHVSTVRLLLDEATSGACLPESVHP